MAFSSVVRVLAVVALVSVASAAMSKMQIVSSPESVAFDSKAGSIEATAVPGVVAGVLGVQPPRAFTWKGMPVSNPFERPQACATIIVDGLAIAAFEDKLTYPVNYGTSSSKAGVRTLVSGYKEAGYATVGTLISEVYSGTTHVTVSGDSEFAKIVANEYLDSGAEHIVTRTDAGQFFDQAINTDTLQLDLYRESKVTINGVTFEGEDLELFKELDAMVQVSKSVKSGVPAVFTFVVSGYRRMIDKYGRSSEQVKAAHAAIAESIADISKAVQAAYDNQAVVLTVGLMNDSIRHPSHLPGTQDKPFNMKAYVESNHHVARRSFRINRRNGVYDEDGDMSNYSRALALSVSNCQKYTCKCFKAYAGEANKLQDSVGIDGERWATKTNIAKKEIAGCLVGDNCMLNKSDTSSKIECNTICAKNKQYCPCEEATFDPSYLYPVNLGGLFKCESCDPGFRLIEGECYLESTNTAAFNIVLWTGLASVAAIAGVWYALHNIGTPLYASIAAPDDLMSAKKGM